MTSCKELAAESEHSIFYEVEKDTAEFQDVEHYFDSHIKQLYGDQLKALTKIASDENRICKLLQSKNENLGLIVYKNNLTQALKSSKHRNAFEIKTLFVINPIQNSGKKIAIRLIQHISQLAVEKKASSILVTVSSAKPESLAFFLSKGFLVEKITKDAYINGLDEYYLFHPSPQKLLSSTTLELLIPTTPKSRIYFTQAPRETPPINPTLANMRRANLAWHSENIESHYIIVFLNPLYSDESKQSLIGQLLIGITPKGERHALGCFPEKKLPQSYWLEIFKDLKNHGKVKQIDIFSASPKIDLSEAILHTFPSTRLTYSKNQKSWTPNNLHPKSSATALINELQSPQDPTSLAANELYDFALSV